MKDNPLVTVITTTYKKFNCLEETLESVFEQDYPRIEYIISDDGSDNFDREYIEEIINRYKRDNIESIQVIHHEKNMGTVKNINIATKRANGEFIIGLGLEDAFVSSSTISQIVQRMLEKDCELLAYSRIQCSAEGKQLRRMPCKAFYQRIEKLDTPRKQYRALVTGFYYEMASGSSICSRKRLLDKMNYYAEDYKYWEDGPYLAKYNMNGMKIDTAYDIDGIFYRLGGISNGKAKVISKAVQGLKDDAYMFYKCELERNPSLLSRLDARKVKYAILRNRNDSILKKYILMVQYVDVVICRAIMKIRYKLAVNREYKTFIPISKD